MSEIDRDAICANCQHPYRMHSGLAGCWDCKGDDFCERFVDQATQP